MGLATPLQPGALAIVEFLAPGVPSYRITDGFGAAGLSKPGVGHYRLQMDDYHSPTDPGLTVFACLEDMVNAELINYDFAAGDNRSIDIYTYVGGVLTDADVPFSVRVDVQPTQD